MRIGANHHAALMADLTIAREAAARAGAIFARENAAFERARLAGAPGVQGLAERVRAARKLHVEALAEVAEIEQDVFPFAELAA